MKLKLKKNEYNGKTYVKASLSKLDAISGEGFTAKDFIVGKVPFEPTIKKDIPYYDKKTGAPKTFTAIELKLNSVSGTIDKTQLGSEYQDITISLPDKMLNQLEGKSWKGKQVIITFTPYYNKLGALSGYFEINEIVPKTPRQEKIVRYVLANNISYLDEISFTENGVEIKDKVKNLIEYWMLYA